MAKKRLKKLLASALAVSMAATLLPAAVMANADAEIVNEPIALEGDADAALSEVTADESFLVDVWKGESSGSNFTSANFDATLVSYNSNQQQVKDIVKNANGADIYINHPKLIKYGNEGGSGTQACWFTIGLTLVDDASAVGGVREDRYVPSSQSSYTGEKVFKWFGIGEKAITDPRTFEWVVSKNGTKQTIKLTTNQPEIEADQPSTTMAQGDTVKLNFTTKPANPTGGLSMESSEETIATVTSDGTVTGVNPGVATITAKMYGEDNLVATCEVTVTEKSSTGGDAIVTPEPTTTVDPSVTPDPSETPDASVTPEPSETPDASVTPEPTGTPGTITPEPTNTPEPTPTEPVKKGDEVETKTGTVVVTNTKTNTVAFDTVDGAATTVTIPKTVKIDGVAYTVTTIKASAFADSKKLTNVTIPATITAIGKNAFAGCSKLTKVTVKSTKLKAIKANTFKDCKALTSISLPKSVTSIGKNVFSGCSKLKTITIKATTLKVKKGAFKGIAKNAVIKVPKSKVKAFSKILKKAGFKGTVKAI